ncbi:hypothetical protein HDV01_005269 [Terramyces sp. JEL0728]|nr:hypothetical protein HDV01_005269 [Terramyces sp. JEL0728]
MLRDDINSLKQKFETIRTQLEKLDIQSANPLIATIKQDQDNLKLFVEDLNRGVGFSYYNSILPTLSIFLTVFVLVDAIIKINTGVEVDSMLEMELKRVRMIHLKKRWLIYSCILAFPFIFIFTPAMLSDRIYFWILLLNLFPALVLICDHTRTYLAIEYLKLFRQSSFSLAVINGVLLLYIVFYYAHIYICVNNFTNEYSLSIKRPFYVLLLEGISFVFGWAIRPQGAGYQYTAHIIVGTVISSLFMANITIYLLSLNVPTREFTEKLEEVDQFVLAKGVGKEIHERMIAYYHFKYTDAKYFDEQKILHELNTPLKLVEHFLKEDIIIEEGSTGDQMYFVAKGKMNAFIKGIRVGSIKPGDYFGEISLLFEDVKRTATIEAVTNCILYSLNRQDFRKIIELDSSFSGIVTKFALKRMARDKIDILPYTPLKRMAQEKAFQDNDIGRNQTITSKKKPKNVRLAALDHLLKPTLLSKAAEYSSNEQMSAVSEIDDVKSSIHASSAVHNASQFINGSFIGSENRNSNAISTCNGALPNNDQIISLNLQDVSMDIKCNDKILNVRDETVAQSFVKSKLNCSTFPDAYLENKAQELSRILAPPTSILPIITSAPITSLTHANINTDTTSASHPTTHSANKDTQSQSSTVSTQSFNTPRDRDRQFENNILEDSSNATSMVTEPSSNAVYASKALPSILERPELKKYTKERHSSTTELSSTSASNDGNTRAGGRRASIAICGNRDFIQLSVSEDLDRKHFSLAMIEFQNEHTNFEKNTEAAKVDLSSQIEAQKGSEMIPSRLEKPDAISDAHIFFNQSKAIFLESEKAVELPVGKNQANLETAHILKIRESFPYDDNPAPSPISSVFEREEADLKRTRKRKLQTNLKYDFKNFIASISIYAGDFSISDYAVYYSMEFHEAAARMLNNGCGALAPSTPQEYYLRTINMLLNAFFLALYVGNISRYMIGLDSTGRKFHEQLEQVGQYISYKGLGRELKHKILHLYNLKYINSKYFDEERIFQELNQPLKLSIYLRECAPLIRQVPFFKSSEKGFISNLVTMLKPIHFLKDDIVIEKGSVGAQMFFISSGYLEVTLNGRVLGKLSPGQYFGEIALLLRNPKRTATIKALTDCFLFSLTREALYKIKDWYPDVGKRMQEMADERIEADKLNFMKEVPFFKGATKEFFSEVFTALRMVAFEAGDVIIEKGTIGEEMYFIIGGSVNVVINDVVTFTMSAGMYFGEIAIIMENTKRTVNIVAATFCTLYSLSKYDLNTIIVGHPELADKMLQVASERIFNDKIRNILTKVPFLKTASNDVVAKLAKLIQIVPFQAGDQIYDIGMPGDSMFFIISGEIGIYDEERKISHLTEGQFFGEICLIFKDAKRTCKVVAVTNCELYELGRLNLNKVLADDPKLGDIIQSVATHRIMENKVRKLVSQVPIMHGASKSALSKIVKLLKLERYYHGNMVVKKGDIGNGMYFIAYGTLNVVRDDKIVAVLESGQYFGEIDLLSDCVRTASVISTGTCELYYLSKENFKEVVAEFPQIQEVLEQAANERIQNDKIRKLLNDIPFFAEVEDSIISEIFDSLTLVHYFPNSIIFEKDEIGSCMYFVASGSLVGKIGKEVITYMKGGQFFGEISLLFDSKRTASVCTETDCTLYTLQRADLDGILLNFPIAAAKLKKVAHDRLRYDNIREMIKKVSFFKDVEEEAVLDITKILKTEPFHAGEYVILKDQLADKMYFVISGKFQVIINDVVVSELSNSHFFGGTVVNNIEIAILQADSRRTASVKSAGEGELLSLSRVELQGALKKYPKILNSLKTTVEKRLAKDGLRARILDIPIFKEANSNFILELIDNLTTEIHFSEDKIITQGDLADAMYFITFGEVQIFIDEQKIGAMSSGQYFGEIALLTENTLRTASIVAVGTCEFLKLNKFSFNLIVEKYPEERLRLQLEAEKLIINDKVRILQISKLSPFFKCKKIALLEAAAEKLTVAKSPANKVIFEKNSNGDCIYFVKSGKVTIKDSATFMYDLKKGDCFGGILI